MRLLTNSDPLKDRWLSKRLCAKFGHSSVEEANEELWYSADVSATPIPSPFVEVASFQLL